MAEGTKDAKTTAAATGTPEGNPTATYVSTDADVTYGKAEALPVEVARTPTGETGQSEAEKAAQHEAALRAKEPNKVVYRQADEALGGNSFDYGRPAQKS